MIERLLYTRYEAVPPWISGMFLRQLWKREAFYKKGKARKQL